MSFTASNSTVIEAPKEKVWEALTTPELVKQYVFGAEVISDWKKGGQLNYRGEWEGKTFEDKGTILEIEPGIILKATYFSPMSGMEDKPENYAIVTYELSSLEDTKTELTITQENIATQESADKMTENWGMTLQSIKDLLEK